MTGLLTESKPDLKNGQNVEMWPSTSLLLLPSRALTCFDSIPPSRLSSTLSWQLWAPIQSHPTLPITSSILLRVKFPTQPCKPTLLVSVSGALGSVAPVTFPPALIRGSQTNCGNSEMSVNMRWNDAIPFKQSGDALIWSLRLFQSNFWKSQWKTITRTSADCLHMHAHKTRVAYVWLQR